VGGADGLGRSGFFSADSGVGIGGRAAASSRTSASRLPSLCTDNY
jgi:hypothetical protein